MSLAGQVDLLATRVAVDVKRLRSARGLPSYAGLPNGPYNPGLGLYNAKGSNMRKTHAAIVKAQGGGTAKLNILVIGDSVGTGYNGSTIVDRNSYPQRLARGLAAHLGVPLAGGFHPALSASATSSDRWTLNTGTVNATTYAGLLVINTASAVTYTCEVPSTGFDLLYTDLSLNNFTYQIDGGSTVPVTTTATATYKKLSITGLSYGKHTIRINNPGGAGTFVFLVGVIPTYATGVAVHNLSFGGARAAGGTAAVNWTDTSANQLYSNHKLGWDAAGITPDLVICELGGNDIFQGDTPATAIAGLSTIRGWYSSADFMLVSLLAINGTNTTNFDSYSSLKYGLADTLDCTLVDIRTKTGDYTEAQGNGLLGADNTHFTDAMNSEIGRLIVNSIVMNAGGLTDLDPETSGLVDRKRGGIEAVAVADGTTGTVTLRLGAGSVFTLSPTGNVTTLAITDVPATGKSVAVTLIVTQGGTPRTIATPSGGKFLGAATPTQVASKVCVFTYETVDGGTTWLCSASVEA